MRNACESRNMDCADNTYRARDCAWDRQYCFYIHSGWQFATPERSERDAWE